jgi:flagellar biosynthesis/type III secretory pathway protein FliH
MTFDELERTSYINDDQSTLQIIEVCREHFSDLTDDQRTELYDEGYEVGFKDAKSEGYDDGYDEGIKDGKSEGFKDGKSEGYDDGKSEGYDDGYEAGYAAAMRDNNTPY